MRWGTHGKRLIGHARRPDVLAIDRNGGAHPIEVQSRTDTGARFRNLTTRNNQAQQNLHQGNTANQPVIVPYDGNTHTR